MTVDFSLEKYFNDFRYKKLFKKYFKKNIFLDTFAFSLIIQGKFDENMNYNTLIGDKNNKIFMNLRTYKKLMNLLGMHQGKLIITSSVVSESLNHIFEAIENKYKTDEGKKEIEEKFVDFLKSEIKLFKEKQPLIKDLLNHRWVEETKHHKIRNRIEVGDLSIFVESDKCKYNAIITKDQYKKNKDGECIKLDDTIIVQLDILSMTQ
ncbi:MAG TPA: hypothetical protein ENH46_07070 [Candidatus Pacearchaeota archaeon]|nr:hypothetical protein [Candidatus Pacearchaeota archaeon]